MKKKVFLDFDGVLIDSAFEAFRIAASSASIINSPFQNSIDNRYMDFLFLRKRVAPAWNYYYVIRELFETDYKNQTWDYNKTAQEFENFFIEERNKSMKYHYKKWLALHKKYFNFSWLDDVDCVDIITNKPKASVQELLRVNHCSKLASRVFDRTDWPDHTDKTSFIDGVYDEQKFDAAIFVDDHFETIYKANILNGKGVKSYHALWGYSDQCKGVTSLTMDQFKPTILDFIK